MNKTALSAWFCVEALTRRLDASQIKKEVTHFYAIFVEGNLVAKSVR